MVGRMIRRVHMPEYNPSLLGGLNWGGGSFTWSQYPTVVYMTFFPNDEIQKFFPGFDGTLSIQYHKLKLLNIALLSTIPWLSISNLIHKIVLCTILDWSLLTFVYGCLKDMIMKLKML